jgi:hypothetical protein
MHETCFTNLGHQMPLSHRFFRPFGADIPFTPNPRLTPWASFLRRFAADPQAKVVGFILTPLRG